ncbi:hypothetical protein PC116_g10014 [Phytophthora cactorum]|uniref:Uncharacterized protein n=1 Tax=Phytophthora cactorum TaxID=29920 RepID=A0A329SV99_9STRA|nr:hypothetical protein PC116_g10014 [Phytophthora cactorum]RAW40754.1 hypothetical protein PC110_g3047 [Phytophthora cactorum]
MDAAREILEKTRPICAGGYSTHELNLLIEDLIKLYFFKAVHTEALAITTYVRDHHELLSQFQTTLSETNNSRRRALVVPVSTRWYSLYTCLSRTVFGAAVSNLIQNTASSPAAKKKCRQVNNSIRDRGFWNKLEQVVGFLGPVIEALRELESDNCPISRVYSRFRELLNHPAYGTEIEQSDLQAAIKTWVEYHWNFVQTDATGLAFLLDSHTNLNRFVGSDEGDTIKQGCAFAERSGILARLGVSRAQFNGSLYHFTGVKRRWSPGKRAEYAGAEPRAWWYSNQNEHPLVWEIAKLVIRYSDFFSSEQARVEYHGFHPFQEAQQVDDRKGRHVSVHLR